MNERATNNRRIRMRSKTTLPARVRRALASGARVYPSEGGYWAVVRGKGPAVTIEYYNGRGQADGDWPGWLVGDVLFYVLEAYLDDDIYTADGQPSTEVKWGYLSVAGNRDAWHWGETGGLLVPLYFPDPMPPL
jgi:hypothetical protein